MSDFGENFIIALGLIVVAFILGLFAAFPVMWLWNFVMPAVFGLTKITFWQAFALYVLSNMLFKSAARTSKD